MIGICPSSVRPSVNIFVSLNNLNSVWNILTILHSYVEQVMTMCRVQNESSGFITFLVIPHLMLFYAYSCPLCNLNTIWNIIMILHGYVELVMTMCFRCIFMLAP